jgi:hypothetical protein
MFEDKTNKSIEKNVLSDPIASLEGVKGSGDKMSLLDSLVAEGKFSNSPYVGPQRILSETSVTSGEILHHSVTGSSTAEIEGIKALPENMKNSLMERVLADKPNTSIKEIRAACAVLEIDAEPFIKSAVETTTKELQQNLEQGKESRKMDNAILTLFYKDTELIAAVDKNIERSMGQTITDQFDTITKDYSRRLALDIALIGQTSDPLLDLKRMEILMAIERQKMEKRALPLSTAENVHIEKMQQSLNQAKELLDKLNVTNYDEIPPSSLAEFNNFLKNSQENYFKFIDAEPWWNNKIYLVILALILILFFVWLIKDSFFHKLVILTISVGIWWILFNKDEKNRANTYRTNSSNVKSMYQTESEKRAEQKAKKLRASS